MKRAYSPAELSRMSRRLLEDLPAAWHAMLGVPEATGTWFIWGNSGNGKTSFVMQLCKMLTRYGTVVYNSMEEGTALTITRAIERAGLRDCKGRFKLVDGESVAESSDRMKKRRAPDFMVIDSLQYTGMSYREYIRFKSKHPHKILIFVSHADGKLPSGRAARSVMYDASLKIWVEGYKAFSKGRYIGETGEYTIWEKGAAAYWGTTEIEETNDEQDGK